MSLDKKITAAICSALDLDGDGEQLFEGSIDPSELSEIANRRILAQNAQREREIRADLIEDVRDALRRVYNDAAAGELTVTALAEAAVDAVADYYRRAER